MAPLPSAACGLGTTSSGSIFCSEPSPLQVGQAPKGLLKEKSRGSTSGIVKPDTGQANFEEKMMRLGSPLGSFSSAYSMTAMPSASSSAVSKDSASLAPMSARTTMRSTTTSMSCLSFLSRVGASAISWYSPSIFRRWKPRFRKSAISLRYSPLRPRITGASRKRRVRSGRASTLSTIWLTVWLSMGRPVAGE